MYMKFLLINTNQIVQKLVEITAKKAGADLTTITESSQLANLEQYDYILVDDDCFGLDSQAYTDALKDKRKCLIYNKQGKRIEGFDDYVQKPFLPTSILDIFTAQLSKQAPAQNPEKTPLDSVDSALGAEFDAALNGESLDNAGNAPIELDNLNEGLEEIDNLLDDNLESSSSGDSNVDSSNVIKQESVQAESDDSGDSQAENTESEEMAKEAALEEPTLDIEQATDELNPEATLDEGLDIDLDLSGLDELEGFSDDEQKTDTAKSMTDSQETEHKAEAASEAGDMGDLGDLSDLDDLTQDENLTESTADSTAEENPTDTQDETESLSLDDELSLDELDLADETGEDSKDSEQESIEIESQGLDDLGDLDDEMTNLDSTREIVETQSAESTQDELGGLDDLENLNDDAGENDNLGETKQTQNADDLGELDNLDDLDSLGDLAGLENELGQAEPDNTAESQHNAAEQSIEPTNSTEDLDTESLDDLGDEALSLDELDDLDSLDTNDETQQDTTQEATDSHIPLDDEFSSEGLLENDLLDNVEKVSLNEPVLDKEQVNEVSKALQAIDEESADFTSLKEPQIAEALGEKLPEELLSLDELSESDDKIPDESLENMSLDSQDMTESALAQNSHEQGTQQDTQPQEIVKNMITNSVQSSISSLSSNNLKSMLDGLEVTINISFKDKSK
ncbi:hypothetical protein [Helicobacter cinaedi]|uniref:hypothetical protein n=1 Tax=Helicobacter cinaedi TaxID=213 RepID=UPI000CF18C72